MRYYSWCCVQLPRCKVGVATLCVSSSFVSPGGNWDNACIMPAVTKVPHTRQHCQSLPVGASQFSLREAWSLTSQSSSMHDLLWSYSIFKVLYIPLYCIILPWATDASVAKLPHYSLTMLALKGHRYYLWEGKGPSRCTRPSYCSLPFALRACHLCS